MENGCATRFWPSCGPRIENLKATHRPPGLAVILVGHDPASEIYVRDKIKTCGELGIYSEKITPPEYHLDRGTARHHRRPEPAQRNRRHPGADPLPKQVDKHRVLVSVMPDKDVDGFHPVNVGNLVADIPGPRACTPAGIMEMLRRYDIPVRAKTPWWWAAAISSANRWRCCCSIRTPP